MIRKRNRRAVRWVSVLLITMMVMTMAGGVAATAASTTSSGSGSTSSAASSSSQNTTSSTVDQSKIPLTNLITGWPQYTETLNEESAVLIDADTGGILYSLNRNDMRYPASTTKIMTALLVLENCSLKDTVTMSQDGTSYVRSDSSNAATVTGEQFTVEQCLYMMLLKSANDIAVQLGIQVAGSTSAFAELMNQRAEQIGCTSTHFTNACGMPDSDHYTTAYDLALIMQECLKNETFRKIISTTSYTVPATNKTAKERVYDNHNQMIIKSGKYYYQYDIGGKTGFTKAAGRTLVTAAEKDGRTLIAVTMRGIDQTDFVDQKKLFEYGFNNFSNQEVNGAQVTLPNGLGTDQVTQTEEKNADGSTSIVSTYNKLIVGRTLESSDSGAKQTSATAVSTVAGGNFMLLVLIAVFAALVAGIVIVGVKLFRSGKK